ncbi:entericidin A/B family lipoprotein [Paracoccus sp. MBLB3053]|uniref:Entericidin A/B family lipoprotein n=1 Tax=Paracoccus aurantius TaxID=3073814 RepID=A0ABU2HM75_9RHOB|nr:entericidin A/B family lipoprotein [Paracoccus sp. MBLB3053]MDS9466124.1 entericidin A/B family lipoprotein [Paracoccus sp. MBLB3053]
MRRIIQFAPLLGLMAVSACETIQGAGRDLQTAGQAITQQGYESQSQMGQAPYSAAPVAPSPY